MSSTPSATKAKRAHQITRRELLRLCGRLSATYGKVVVEVELAKLSEEYSATGHETNAPRATD